MDALLKNIRYAGRRLVQKPGFTLVAILSLALGIGANTAIFSLVNAILIREVPLDKPEELVEIYLSSPDFEYGVCSWPDYEDLKEGTTESSPFNAFLKIWFVLPNSHHFSLRCLSFICKRCGLTRS